MPSASVDFIVNRQNLRQCKFVPAALPAELELQPGQLLLRVDKFAFTANNITYAVFGDAMQYWNFFPAPAGFGRIPVWGFANVIGSKHAAIKDGERLYGYMPMSTHLVVQPERVSETNFLDGVAHRKPLPAAYQLYHRVKPGRITVPERSEVSADAARTAGSRPHCSADAVSPADPSYNPQHEDQRALLHPLFMTSFLIQDFLADNDFFGAGAVLLSSASSKTALGVAFELKRNQGSKCAVIGLTSARNVDFCEKLGYYDRVLTYDQLASLPSERPTVFVDMAGEGKLLHDIHHHFRESLKYSCMVGGTHWEQRETQHKLPAGDTASAQQRGREPADWAARAPTSLRSDAMTRPGAKPVFFFAPTQIKKRIQNWGQQGMEQRFAEAWRAFLPSVNGWLQVIHGRGEAAVKSVYQEVLEGKLKPEQGHMLSLRE
ncbi:MAG: DUF2855 family protein [Nevskiales bacterium]